MNLPGFIARRYLFARKSHNVINIVSGISAAGIATGCAALIIILSIYNGFDTIIRSLSDSHTPDLLVQSADGRRFDPAEPVAALNGEPGVRTTCGTLEEKVYLRYGDRQCVAQAKGVDAEYQEVTGLQDYLTEGTFTLMDSTGRAGAVIGRTLALELGLRPVFLTSLEVWFPSRTAEIQLLDPYSALHREVLEPKGIVSLEQGFDKKYVFVPLAILRRTFRPLRFTSIRKPSLATAWCLPHSRNGLRQRWATVSPSRTATSRTIPSISCYPTRR